VCIITRVPTPLTAFDASRLADRVRNEYLTRKRDTEPVADALDALARILAWAETPDGVDARSNTSVKVALMRYECKAHVRELTGTAGTGIL
jgi:hypothetical protein